MSNYPGAFDDLTATVAAADAALSVNHRPNHLALSEAIEAVQVELGLDPAGGSTDVTARLAALQAALGTLGPYTETRVPVTSATTVDLDLSAGNNFGPLTPTHNVTFTASNIPSGTVTTAWRLTVTNGATPRTFTYPAGWKWPDGVTAPTAIGANKRYVITGETDDAGTTVYASFRVFS